MSAAPLLNSAPGASDVVYLPLLPARVPQVVNSPVSNLKCFYPVAGLPRMPLAHGELTQCLGQLDTFVQTSQSEIYGKSRQSTSWMKCAGTTTGVLMLVVFTNFSQQSAIVFACFPLVFLCACNMFCATCSASINQNRVQQALLEHGEDMFFSEGTSTKRRLEEKLAELGDKYNVTFDLFSAAHVVDKQDPGFNRQIFTLDEAKQKKSAYDSEHGTSMSFPAQGGIVYCVALRSKQAPSAPPPLPPPFWLQDKNPSVDVFELNFFRGFKSAPSYSDPAVAKCAAELERVQAGDCLKKCPVVLTIAFLWMGGGGYIISGSLHSLLGIGCTIGTNNCPQHGSPAMWIVFYCIVFAWLSAVALSMRAVTSVDPMAALLRKVSELNEQNASTGLEIHIGVETAMREAKHQSGGQNGQPSHTSHYMAIRPEPVFYAWRRGV